MNVWEEIMQSYGMHYRSVGVDPYLASKHPEYLNVMIDTLVTTVEWFDEVGRTTPMILGARTFSSYNVSELFVAWWPEDVVPAAEELTQAGSRRLAEEYERKIEDYKRWGAGLMPPIF